MFQRKHFKKELYNGKTFFRSFSRGNSTKFNHLIIPLLVDDNQILLSHMLIKMAFCTAHTTKIFFQNIINIGLIMTRCKCFLCFGQKKKLWITCCQIYAVLIVWVLFVATWSFQLSLEIWYFPTIFRHKCFKGYLC